MRVNLQLLLMLNLQNIKMLLHYINKIRLFQVFFVKKNTAEENKVVLSELVATYHGVVHHHSCASQDCGNKLLSKLCPDSSIASKISCGRTKATSYVENILGPKAKEICVIDLKSAGFFGIGSDASNKGNKKLFPITVRYFSRSEGLKDRLLDFYHDNDETSTAIASKVKEIIEDNELSLQFTVQTMRLLTTENIRLFTKSYCSRIKTLCTQTATVIL